MRGDASSTGFHRAFRSWRSIWEDSSHYHTWGFLERLNGPLGLALIALLVWWFFW